MFLHLFSHQKVVGCKQEDLLKEKSIIMIEQYLLFVI